jgi:hypothetical protein
MEEDEKVENPIENPSVEYDGMPSPHDDYSAAAPSGRFRSRYNTVWQQVSPRDRKYVAIAMLVAMLALLLLNIINIVKTLEEL